MPSLDALAGVLPPFLLQQRWFGGKARSLSACQVEDVAELAQGSDAAIVIVRVQYGDGPPERYAMLVACHADERALPAIGRLEPGGVWASEAVGHAAIVRVLLRGFANGGMATAGGGRVEFADASDVVRATVTDPDLPIRLLGAEQSNTSLRVGPGLVFKLFRRLEIGENPEVEVGRFLSARTTFRATPRLHGSLSYRAPSGEVSTLGVLQSWVDNQGDGWSYTLRQLGHAIRQGDSTGVRGDMDQLGSVTAQFHAALESDADTADFAPVPIRDSDVETWTAQVAREAEATLALVFRQSHAWADESRRMAERVLAAAPGVGRVLSTVDVSLSGLHAIRIHGDYHLGQTLKTDDGFVIIDFEGEPARPLALRRSKQCALKDVAGMLRSIEYAVATGADRAEAEGRLRLTGAMRQAFLDRYVETARQAHALSIPADRRMIDRWIAFFEFEKSLYELRYEINNRPAWVPIPLRAVLLALEQAVDRAGETGVH